MKAYHSLQSQSCNLSSEKTIITTLQTYGLESIKVELSSIYRDRFRHVFGGRRIDKLRVTVSYSTVMYRGVEAEPTDQIFDRIVRTFAETDRKIRYLPRAARYRTAKMINFKKDPGNVDKQNNFITTAEVREKERTCAMVGFISQSHTFETAQVCLHFT